MHIERSLSNLKTTEVVMSPEQPLMSLPLGVSYSGTPVNNLRLRGCGPRIHQQATGCNRREWCGFCSPPECNGGPSGGTCCFKVVGIYNRAEHTTLVGQFQPSHVWLLRLHERRLRDPQLHLRPVLFGLGSTSLTCVGCAFYTCIM